MSLEIHLLRFFAVLVICIHCATPVKHLPLPDFVKPCSKSASDFEECCVKNGRDAIPHLLNGVKEYNVPVLNPLVLPNVEMDSDNFKIAFKDLHIFGLGTADLKKLKINLDKKEIDIHVTFDRIAFTGKYDVNGQILVMQLQGDGNINVTLDKVDMKYHIDYTLEEKSGDEYLVMSNNPRIDYTLGKAYINLDNLFGGNKELGDATLKAINENWAEFMDSLKPVISTTMAQIVQSIIGSMANNVPYKNIFLD